MIAVYIKDGKLQGKSGWLFTIDGRTAEVVTRKEIIRVDREFIRPLSLARTFAEIDDLVEAYIKGDLDADGTSPEGTTEVGC